MTAIQFIDAVLGLFSGTLAAMMDIPVFVFFLAFMLLGLVYALFRYVLYVSKTGVNR